MRTPITETLGIQLPIFAFSSNLDYWTYAVGQAVGDMKGPTTVKREIERMLIEYGMRWSRC